MALLLNLLKVLQSIIPMMKWSYYVSELILQILEQCSYLFLIKKEIFSFVLFESYLIYLLDIHPSDIFHF
jgi:hypothetical protein